MKKVIAFSLWGDNPKYTIGAIKNADLATTFYPDWMCRFYVAQNVPRHIIEELRARNNTDVVVVHEKPDWTGMFWRFFAACDPSVDVMLCRDTDSRLGEREMLAVQEWENSDWGFHIMRDHPQHGAAIMGGLWGVKKGVIPNLAELIETYHKGDFYQVDQHFLREMIYPLIRDNALIHDPICDQKPFPSRRVGYQFVGQVFDEHDQPVSWQSDQLQQFLQAHHVAEPSEQVARVPSMRELAPTKAASQRTNTTAYPLSTHVAPLRPAFMEQTWLTEHAAVAAELALDTTNGTGWALLCPYSVEVTWNGGPAPEDIVIRRDAPDDAPAFVQSVLGGGLLTFHTGYQFQTEAPHSLWVRGPINRPKDGLAALEQIVDTSLLPCTIIVIWQCTRPHQTVRFEAGELFGLLLPYPQHDTNPCELDVIRPEDSPERFAHQLQAPAMQDVLQRFQQWAYLSGPAGGADSRPSEEKRPNKPERSPEKIKQFLSEEDTQSCDMSVLIIQENGRHGKNQHFRECFAVRSAFQHMGWKADIWGLGHPGFPSFVCGDSHKPLDFNAYDVILNLENYDMTGWVPSLAHVKTYKILWVIDAHVRGMEPYSELYLRDHYDLILQATRDFIVEETDARIKKNSIWFPNCFNDALIYPQDRKKSHDIGFCGNIVNREPYLSFIEQSFQLKRDIFVIGADMVQAINCYKIHFNKNIANDINYRNFETLGCKTLLLTNANPHYRDLGFVDGENCLIYRNLSELQDKIHYALDHPQQREQIAEHGYQLGKRHTYHERVTSLVTLLQRNV